MAAAGPPVGLAAARRRRRLGPIISFSELQSAGPPAEEVKILKELSFNIVFPQKNKAARKSTKSQNENAAWHHQSFPAVC
jgi:hypothetical protein